MSIVLFMNVVTSLSTEMILVVVSYRVLLKQIATKWSVDVTLQSRKIRVPFVFVFYCACISSINCFCIIISPTKIIKCRKCRQLNHRYLLVREYQTN